jgi:hypothetical protein
MCPPTHSTTSPPATQNTGMVVDAPSGPVKMSPTPRSPFTQYAQNGHLLNAVLLVFAFDVRATSTSPSCLFLWLEITCGHCKKVHNRTFSIFNHRVHISERCRDMHNDKLVRGNRSMRHFSQSRVRVVNAIETHSHFTSMFSGRLMNIHLGGSETYI